MNSTIAEEHGIRNAVLYWDEVSSIVPYEDYPNFSPEVLFLQRSGVYKAVYPQKLFSSEFAEDFCNSIVKRIAAYEARTVNNENTNSRVRVHKNKVYAPALHELIHYRKLPPQLLGYFENKRYINDYNVDGWMEIDSKIAQIYMRTLAEYSIKCSDKDIVLGTDTFTHSREIYSPSRNHANLQAQCCKINIENCLPQPSMDVRFEDILEFKSKRKDELNAFRAKIRELEINIYNADSPELIRHYETQFIEEWQQCSQDYIHITNYELRALLSDIYNISEEDELWLEKYYKTAYKLLEKDSFQTAVHTMASYRWHSVPRVQLAVIWSGIESLFNVNTEVSFRISLYIANFLGENEAQAQQIFKQVRKIYSSRSSAVHGNKTKDNLESAVEESANLLTRILRRCAELNKLPDVDNLAFRVDKQKQGIKCKILVP